MKGINYHEKLFYSKRERGKQHVCEREREGGGSRGREREKKGDRGAMREGEREREADRHRETRQEVLTTHLYGLIFNPTKTVYI